MPVVTVPSTLEEVLDPEWLTSVLSDLAGGERVVEAHKVDTSKTLAEKVRFQARIEGADGAVRTASYCAKAHLDGSPTTVVGEALFYSELAPRLPGLRMPGIYYAGADRAAGLGIVIMDDIHAVGGRFLNAHQPYPVDTARQTLGLLARLHGATWGLDLVSDLDWLEARAAPIAEVYPREMLQKLLVDGRGDGIAPELLDADNLLDAMSRTAARDITCVLHGDTHSGNVYLDAEGRPCWLDWQVVQLGNWAVDVSYHLGTVLDVETRRANEQDLLRHYLTELAAHGGPRLDWDEGWDLYRSSFSYGYFLWVITRISSREVVLVHIPRLAAAMTDHQTYRRLGVV